MDTNHNHKEEETKTPIAGKAGKLTKRFVKLGIAGLNKTKEVPGKTVTASKKGASSFKEGYKSA
jgi:hypothetical protein